MVQKRRKLFVDRPVQGALVVRSILYWVTCLAIVSLMMLGWSILSAPEGNLSTDFELGWFRYGPVLIATLLMLPLVVIDIIRLSNRFAGPMLRIRRAMHDLAEGKSIEPIFLRKSDFWHEFAADLNRVAARMRLSERRTDGRIEPFIAEEPNVSVVADRSEHVAAEQQEEAVVAEAVEVMAGRRSSD